MFRVGSGLGQFECSSLLVVQLSGRSLLTGVDSGTVTSTDCIAPDLMQG